MLTHITNKIRQWLPGLSEVPVILLGLAALAIFLIATFFLWQIVVPIMAATILQETILLDHKHKTAIGNAVAIAGIILALWLHPMPDSWLMSGESEYPGPDASDIRAK